MQKKRVISISLVLVMLLSLFPMQFSALATGSPYTGDGFEIQYKVTSKWTGAQNIQMTLKNTGSSVMNNWAVGFTASGSADSAWGATVGTAQEGYCLVENAGWNAKITVNGSVTFGFTLRTDETFNPGVFYIGDEARNPPVTPTDPDDQIVDPGEPDIDWDNLDMDDDDGDGLVNGLEDYFGTDKNNPDTDSDGISDGYETLTLDSDPLIPDSDLDFDEDGLTNLEEYTLGTDPWSADTDGDGLTDYDEVYTYNTDPLKEDTDDDTIWDGDEIELGLDPLNPITDGVTPDGERVFTRQISEDAFDSSVFEDNAATPHLTLVSIGNPENQVVVTESENVQLAKNPAIIGKNIDISLTDLVEGGTIGFEMEQSRPLNELMICRYDPETQDLLPLETTLDENGYFSAELDGSGNYFVLDVEGFLDYLDFDINEYLDTQPIAPAAAPSRLPNGSLNASESNEMKFASINAETGEVTAYTAEQVKETAGETAPVAPMSMGITPAAIDGPPTNPVPTVDVIFLVDTTQSMIPQKDRILQKIGSTMDKLESDPSINAKFAVAEYGGRVDEPGFDNGALWRTVDSHFNDAATAKRLMNEFSWGKGSSDFGRPAHMLEWLLGFFKYNGRTPAKYCHVVIITDSDFRTDKSHNFQTVMDNYVANNVACSAVWPPNPGPPVSDPTAPKELPKFDSDIARTGGESFNITASFESELAEHLKKPIVRRGKAYITLKGLSRVQLNSYPSNIDYTTDSDGDGLLDREELKFPSDTTDIYAWVSHYYAATPAYAGQLKFISTIRIAVWDYNSDPSEKDSDGDGLEDKDDPLPRQVATVMKFVEKVKELEDGLRSLKETGDLNEIAVNCIRVTKRDKVNNTDYTSFPIWTIATGGSIKYLNINKELEKKDLCSMEFFEKNNYLIDYEGKQVDFPHMMATLSALYYKDSPFDGHIDLLAGWAGDLQSFIFDLKLSSAKEYGSNPSYSEMKKYVKSHLFEPTIDGEATAFENKWGFEYKERGFPEEDLNADADAVNLKEQSGKVYLSLWCLLYNYYRDIASDNRYALFVDNYSYESLDIAGIDALRTRADTFLSEASIGDTSLNAIPLYKILNDRAKEANKLNPTVPKDISLAERNALRDGFIERLQDLCS